MKNQKGFLLTEALIALSLLTVVAISLASVTNWSSSAVSWVSQNKALDRVSEDILAAIGDDDTSCSAMFAGAFLDPSMDGVPEQTLPQLVFHGPKGAVSGTIMKNGEALPGTGVTVKDIRLRPLVRVSALVIAAELEVTFAKSGVLGALSSVRTFPLLAVIKNQHVVSCSGTAVGRPYILERACEVQNDGYAFYDVASDACADTPNVQWFLGPDANSASCPAGWRAALSKASGADAYKVCASAAPATMGVPPRSYTNGTTDSSAVYPSEAELDLPTNTCTFSYNSDPDPLVQAKIKCVQEN